MRREINHCRKLASFFIRAILIHTFVVLYAVQMNLSSMNRLIPTSTSLLAAGDCCPETLISHLLNTFH